MNQIMISGNLGRDPEFKTLGQNNTPCLKFSVAVKPNWRGPKSQEKPTSWHNVVVWGKLAEHLSASLVKGSKVFVLGEYTVRQYQGKDGTNKYAYEIVADEAHAISKTASKADLGAGSNYTDPINPSFTEDNIPF